MTANTQQGPVMADTGYSQWEAVKDLLKQMQSRQDVAMVHLQLRQDDFRSQVLSEFAKLGVDHSRLVVAAENLTTRVALVEKELISRVTQVEKDISWARGWIAGIYGIAVILGGAISLIITKLWK
jgi:hypothetical protein